MGRVEPYKRIDLILQSLVQIRRHVPDARLFVVGGGTGLDAVREQVRRLGLEHHVVCSGQVNEADKLRYIHQSDLMLNASEKEGWGLTVLEAAACAVPTVASNVPGLCDAVLNGRTGVLVPHGDVEAMAAAVVGILGDPDRRRRLGLAARAWAERFSWDGVARATAQCVEEIAGGTAHGERLSWFDDEEAGAGSVVRQQPRGRGGR
jgi:glycosyltransferase involved in cell wall biosynthesis